MAGGSTIIVFALLAIEFRRKKFSWFVVYAPFLLLQPAWRLAWNEIHDGWRAASSDCGFGNRGECIFLTTTLVAIFVVILRGDVTKRPFLLRLTIVCAIINALIFVLSYTSFPFATFGLIWRIVEGGANLSGYVVTFVLICLSLYMQSKMGIQGGGPSRAKQIV